MTQPTGIFAKKSDSPTKIVSKTGSSETFFSKNLIFDMIKLF